MFLTLKQTFLAIKSTKNLQFCSFVFCKTWNTTSFKMFVSIKNIALKPNFCNRGILILTQILIKYLITITERRALLEWAPSNGHLSITITFLWLQWQGWFSLANLLLLLILLLEITAQLNFNGPWEIWEIEVHWSSTFLQHN